MGLALNSKRVWVDGAVHRLRPIEARLLRQLVEASGDLVSYDDLARGVWGYDECDQALRNTMQVHVCLLRRKVGRWRIENESGEGYRYTE